MQAAFDVVVDLLDLEVIEVIEVNIFRGLSPVMQEGLIRRVT